MERNGYPAELAIALLVMAAFLYLYRNLPAKPAPASLPVATQPAAGE